MAYSRGDIIEVPFILSGKSRVQPHPAVIISNNKVYQIDASYICIMLSTSKSWDDDFTFEITDNMLSYSSGKEYQQARLNIVTVVTEDQIIKNLHRNSMKKNYVDMLVSQMVDNALY